MNLSKQVYSSGWLKYFDGLVSVAITGLLTPAGVISEFAGTITLENGFVRNLSEDNPHFLDNAKTYIKYNAEDQRMYFDTILISSPELKLEGEGHADILDFVSGLPETFIGQLKFNKIALHPDGLSDSTMKFIDGMLDFRYSLSNSMMEIGQLMLRTDDTTLTSSGAVYLKESEWHINLDTKLGVTEYSNILDLWPTNFKPKSRIWFSENIKSGKIKNAVSSIRLSPEEDLQAMTTFDFVDAEIQVLKNHPNIKGGFGYGTIKNNKFFVKLDSGKVDGLNERKIDLSGSNFFVADTTQKPAIGEFIIFANGYTKDILTDLNKEPVRLLENSKITPKDINGVSQIRAELIMELRNDLEPNEVNYQVIDNIKNFKSNTIIKGRTLSAKELRFEGNNQEFLVSGNAFLDEFPFTYSWNKKHGVTFNDESIVNGTLTLSRESFKALNVEIPNEMMIGEANADFKIALKKDAYPDISVFSNLVGTELNIKSLDWKKKADESGELLLTMTLKEGPEDINFKLTAPRLKAIADFDLSLEGKVKSLNFSNLKITNKVEQLKNTDLERDQKVNSDYLIARMEKVKFFRNYFLK